MSISLLERRRDLDTSASALRYALNEAQRDALSVLERFGWSLRFVRRSADRNPQAWVYDPDHRRMAVIGTDGSLDENPASPVRG